MPGRLTNEEKAALQRQAEKDREWLRNDERERGPTRGSRMVKARDKAEREARENKGRTLEGAELHWREERNRLYNNPKGANSEYGAPRERVRAAVRKSQKKK